MPDSSNGAPDSAEASNCGTLERSGLADAEAAFERPTDMVRRMEARTANRSAFRARSYDHADLSILTLAYKCEFLGAMAAHDPDAHV